MRMQLEHQKPNFQGTAMLSFETVSVRDLDTHDVEVLDALPFGVVGLSSDGIVQIYNATEERLAGLPRQSVIGTHYFSTTAQCMNNFMVAQRFEDEPEIDTIVDYVLTLRMRPTPVRLRLLKAPGIDHRFILIQR